MTMPDRPHVECEEQFPTLAVADVLAAVDFYTTKLGFKTGFTWGEPPTFAGVRLDHVEVHLAQEAAGSTGHRVSFLVGDADELYGFHRANGVEIEVPIADREYFLRDYAIRDLDGNILTFGHHLLNAGPKLKIERVDVPVRLEKRLAGLLRDLAEHKRMSLSSCLEEILLHTSEPLGDGVASPHTKSDLRYIQTLKAKHGIDYDCHASYRFEE